MAKMSPKNFPRDGDLERWAEGEVFAALSRLNDEWTILYSVPWQSLRGGRQGDGEADFVLVHPKSGIFVAEVKGGSSVVLEDGEWFTTNRRGRSKIRDPFDQAVTNKHALHRYLKEECQGFPRSVTMGHLVVFPSAPCGKGFGSGRPREIIIDNVDLANIERAMDKVARHWNSPKSAPAMTAEQIAVIKECLSPDVQIRTVLRDQVRVINSELSVLTNTQINAMRLMRNQRRSLVIGAAGTGKTVLALARAHELAQKGFRTLLVCFNHPLGDQLRNEVVREELMTAGSFHSVCKEMCERYAVLPPGPINERWWDEDLPAMFAEAVYDGDHKFDAIIVDEAQDFHSDWWSYLELALRDSGNDIFCIFADSNQNIYRPGWAPPIDGEPFELDINCRNTVEIAVHTNGLLNFEQETLGIHGFAPVFKEASTERQVDKAVVGSLKKLIDDEKLDSKQIAILSSHRGDVERLRRDNLEDFELGDWQDNSILVETIHRFKGLEADAVILILHDGESDEVRRLAYVGMSRARAILFVIGSLQVRDALKWRI